MSNNTFNVLWKTTQKQLEELATTDYENQAFEPDFNKPVVHKTAFELYVKYITIANRLEQSYDEIVQPQKRILIRKLLDSCLGRVIEIKHDLVGIDMFEFSYNESVMNELNLTPHDIELRIPKYFRREREAEIIDRRLFIESLLKKFGWLEEEFVEEKMSELEAIRIIQMHERARQGRLRAQFMKEIRMLKEKVKPDGVKEKTDGLLAAMKIQKLWRGFATRRKTRRRKLEEMYLIGMIPRPNDKKNVANEEMEKALKARYEIQEEFRKTYADTVTQMKKDISMKQTIPLTEEISDEIRLWFRDTYTRTGKLPDFPSEDNGGSRHLLSRQATESEISRSSAVSSKDSKKTKDKPKTPTRSGDLNVEESFDNGFKISQSIFLPDIRSGIDEFNEVWRDKDETMNTKQTFYTDMLYAEKFNEIESELRKVVDEMMRQELEMLQAALDKDRAQKGKKSKKASKKTRRSGKKSKKKKEKDLTPDRTTESLFEELVANGIIKKNPEINLSSFLGDRSLCERSGINPTPGDIRQIITEYCILPLGSDAIRKFAPCIRSVLIAGPKGSGKKMLVCAMCHEVGGILFDLTPANIVGKYPGKSGLVMLMHLVIKVSRLLQPAVIFMDDAEKPFMKKVPKGDRTDPKRLKKDLPKLIKNIAADDKVIFIGTTSAPWEADQKLLQQTYNRFIYIPRPDYGTLSYVWKELLGQYSGIHSQFDAGAIAKVSDGYTIGSVVGCIKDVLTCKRNLQLRVQPLTHLELINALSSRDPVYKEEEEAFTNWWTKTPLGRRKQKAIEMEVEVQQEKELGKKDKKKGGK
ncbi:Dynein regulatory complex protein 11 [Pseudolycoriella hygida]|uniref:Dynein regulatory complex protein 11 n=1 Tax=Pseudolycoriella hygida TaxID=35572 RepID=A0A9Q0S309_9DIPT|nr:Dynein regulatory complex protein 11 [Pseudolycoriella hygida]